MSVPQRPRIAPYIKLNDVLSPRVAWWNRWWWRYTSSAVALTRANRDSLARSLAQSYLRSRSSRGDDGARSRERAPCLAVFRCARTSADVRPSHSRRDFQLLVTIWQKRHRVFRASTCRFEFVAPMLARKKSAPNNSRTYYLRRQRIAIAVVAQLVQLALYRIVRNVVFLCNKFEVLRNINETRIVKQLSYSNFFSISSDTAAVCAKRNNC